MSAKGRNQMAIVSPTPARLTPIARASSTLLLKTASARKPDGSSSPPLLKVYRPRPQTRNARQGHDQPVLGRYTPRWRWRDRLRQPPLKFTKYRYILPPEAVRAAHRTEQKYRQQSALKQTAPAGDVSMVAATIATVKGSHGGPQNRRKRLLRRRTAFYRDNTTAGRELQIFHEERARIPGQRLVKAPRHVVTCAAWPRNRSILRT